LTGYNVYCSDTAPSTSDTPAATTDASTTTANITGLAAHTTYACIVTAVNGVGESAPSDEVSAAPYEAPGAPTSFAAARGNQLIPLSWQRPDDVGGTPITAYKAYCSVTGDPTVDPANLCGTFGPTLRTGVVRGLTNGVLSYVALAAENAGGTSGLTD